MADKKLHFFDYPVKENIPNPTAIKYGEPPLFIDPDSEIAVFVPICRRDHYFIVRNNNVL